MPLLLAVVFALVPRYCLGCPKLSPELAALYEKENLKQAPKSRVRLLYRPSDFSAKTQLAYVAVPFKCYVDDVCILSNLQSEAEGPDLLLPPDFRKVPEQAAVFLRDQAPHSALGHVTIAHLACRMYELSPDMPNRKIFKQLAGQNLKKVSRDSELTELDTPSLIEAGIVAHYLGFTACASKIARCAAKKDKDSIGVKYLAALLEPDPVKQEALGLSMANNLASRKPENAFQPAIIKTLLPTQ